MVQNRNGSLALTTLCYDYTRGHNLNVIVSQDGSVLFDNEMTDGLTYYYGPDGENCKVIDMGVGLLRPDFLHGELAFWLWCGRFRPNFRV